MSTSSQKLSAAINWNASEHEIGHRPQEIGGELATQKRDERVAWSRSLGPGIGERFLTDDLGKSFFERAAPEVDLPQRPAVRHQLLAHRLAQVFGAPRLDFKTRVRRRPREPAWCARLRESSGSPPGSKQPRRGPRR